MTNSKSMEMLRAAIRIERYDEFQRSRRYVAFTQKMMDFQKGKGPAPTPEAFQQWCEDVERRLALRRLEAGIHERPPEAWTGSRY